MRGDAARPRKYGTPAGEAAKAFAQAWFAGVTEVRLELDEPGRDRDGFGRRLAHVFAVKDGREALFAEVLLRAGWAPYFVKYGRSLRYDARLRAAQAAARADRLGIWGRRGRALPRLRRTRSRGGRARAAQVDAWAADVKGPTPPPNPIRLGVPAETASLAARCSGNASRCSRASTALRDRPRPRRLLFVDAPNRPFAVVVFDPKVWSALDLPAVEARFARVSGIVSEYRGRLQVVLTSSPQDLPPLTPPDADKDRPPAPPASCWPPASRPPFRTARRLRRRPGREFSGRGEEGACGREGGAAGDGDLRDPPSVRRGARIRPAARREPARTRDEARALAAGHRRPPARAGRRLRGDRARGHRRRR